MDQQLRQLKVRHAVATLMESIPAENRSPMPVHSTVHLLEIPGESDWYSITLVDDDGGMFELGQISRRYYESDDMSVEPEILPTMHTEIHSE